MKSFPYRRIAIVGSTASGKSTLASQLAGRFALDFVELDALHWEPNWQEAPDEVFRSRAEAATRAAGWVVAGNYQQVRDIIWARAQLVVWLDYSFARTFWQLTVRTLRRGLTRELLWNGNRENIWWQFKLWSDESLYHWLFQTYWQRRREYPELLARPNCAHLSIVRLGSPRETRNWLQQWRPVRRG